jgi:hypothetical protein
VTDIAKQFCEHFRVVDKDRSSSFKASPFWCSWNDEDQYIQQILVVEGGGWKTLKFRSGGSDPFLDKWDALLALENIQ